MSDYDTDVLTWSERQAALLLLLSLIHATRQNALFRSLTFVPESTAISSSLRRSALASSCLTDERCQRVPPRGVRVEFP